MRWLLDAFLFCGLYACILAVIWMAGCLAMTYPIEAGTALAIFLGLYLWNG